MLSLKWKIVLSIQGDLKNIRKLFGVNFLLNKLHRRVLIFNEVGPRNGKTENMSFFGTVIIDCLQ